MRSSVTRYSSLVILSAASLGVGACSSTRPVSDNRYLNMSVYASNTRIDVGDTTTLSIQSENAAGRQPHFEWKADGAKLEQFENGRIVHVTYATPGTYVVTATMTLQDGTRRTDSRTIEVQRVP